MEAGAFLSLELVNANNSNCLGLDDEDTCFSSFISPGRVSDKKWITDLLSGHWHATESQTRESNGIDERKGLSRTSPPVVGVHEVDSTGEMDTRSSRAFLEAIGDGDKSVTVGAL